jgi:hypothetical protein
MYDRKCDLMLQFGPISLGHRFLSIFEFRNYFFIGRHPN